MAATPTPRYTHGQYPTSSSIPCPWCAPSCKRHKMTEPHRLLDKRPAIHVLQPYLEEIEERMTGGSDQTQALHEPTKPKLLCRLRSCSSPYSLPALHHPLIYRLQIPDDRGKIKHLDLLEVTPHLVVQLRKPVRHPELEMATRSDKQRCTERRDTSMPTAPSVSGSSTSQGGSSLLAAQGANHMTRPSPTVGSPN